MSDTGKTYGADPGAVAALLDAADTAGALAAALARIDATEPAVKGWRILDREGAEAQAARLSRAARGALHGIPVAVKDVIDVAGFPTRAGSRSREHVPPASIDAAVVTRLRLAGAVILGKAHTTEFAFFDGPPPTRNPHDLARTPGGSSSGPAAVVAAGMVPLALGTQTAGSVSRPAAYCGIAAFKPSNHAWSAFGVVPFAPSFDTVGVFGYRTADATHAARALMPTFLAPAPAAAGRPPSVIVIDDPILEAASPAVGASVRAVADKLAAAGVRVEERRSPVSFAELNDRHRLAREYELGHAQAGLIDVPEDAVTPSLRKTVAKGLAIAGADHLAAVEAIASAAARFWAAVADADAVIFPPAPDIAPVGMATGDARFIVPFTALAGPIASIPVGFDQGLPLGIMLAAAPGKDLALIALAERLAPLIETPR